MLKKKIPRSKEKIILISSNYAWTIYNFRLPLINKLKLEGYKVIVLTQFDGYEDLFKDDVDFMLNLYISRKGLNPLIDFITFLNFFSILARYRPDFLLLFSIKPVIYGSLASKLLRVKTISMITGLGTSFILNNWLTKLVSFLYKISISKNLILFFQNSEDKCIFINRKIIKPNKADLIPGSGIDLDQFISKQEKINSDFIFLLIARMIRDKGVEEYVSAAKIVKSKYPKVRFQLLGPLGVQNLSAIDKNQIQIWENEGAIEYMGETDNVIPFIDQASCIVLPSYREGTSRVLLEGAAMSKPLISSDVPGCREVVEDGFNGFLCKVKDSQDLANKIFQMISLPSVEREQMGLNSRKKVEKEFNQEIVLDKYLVTINKHL